MDSMFQDEDSSINKICDQLKLFKISKSSREGDPQSLIYKIFRTKLSPDSLESSHIHDSQEDLFDILGKSDPLSSSGFSPDNKTLPIVFDPMISSEDLILEDFSREEIAHSPPDVKPCIVSVKSEDKQVLRRSSRLASLQAKSNFSLDAVKIEEDDSSISSSKRMKKKLNLRETGRKSRKRSDTSIPDIKSETEKTFEMLFHAKQMKLKHMIINQPAKDLNYMGCPYITISENVLPEFANVDASTVLSTINLHRNSTKSSPKKRKIALFTTRNKSIDGSISCENENYECCFKKVKLDNPYLKKKYQMLDSVTLDYYYAMCGYSLRKTEIFLQDILFDREVTCFKTQYFPSSHRNFLTSANSLKAEYCNSDLPMFHHWKPYPSQNLDASSELTSYKRFCEIILEALKVLYGEEIESL